MVDEGGRVDSWYFCCISKIQTVSKPAKPQWHQVILFLHASFACFFFKKNSKNNRLSSRSEKCLFDEMSIRGSVLLVEVKQPLKCFALETFQLLTHNNIDWAAVKEESRGECKKPEREQESTGEQSVSIGPPPELLAFSAARRRRRWLLHLPATSTMGKYLSHRSYLSALIPQHMHTLVVPLRQNKLPSWKQYALADALAPWKWNAPQPTASRRRGLIKRGCYSRWCLPRLMYSGPAVILSLSPTKYEHSCRKNRLPASYHRHNVWLECSHDEKCLIVKSSFFWFHLSPEMERENAVMQYEPHSSGCPVNVQTHHP